MTDQPDDRKTNRVHPEGVVRNRTCALPDALHDAVELWRRRYALRSYNQALAELVRIGSAVNTDRLHALCEARGLEPHVVVAELVEHALQAWESGEV